MNEAREILAVAREVLGGMPKIPGVSPARMQKWLAGVQEAVIAEVSDAYHGAAWAAEWKVTKVDEDYPDEIVEATLVKAWNRETESVGDIGVWQKCPPEAVPAVNVAIARELKAKPFTGKAMFAWKHGDFEFHHGRGVLPKVGDTFQSEGDAFYRGNWPKNAVEVPIVVTVRRAKWVKSNEEIRFDAEFKTR